jgi:hypothetical protein
VAARGAACVTPAPPPYRALWGTTRYCGALYSSWPHEACHICAGTGPHRCHICAGTGLIRGAPICSTAHDRQGVPRCKRRVCVRACARACRNASRAHLPLACVPCASSAYRSVRCATYRGSGCATRSESPSGAAGSRPTTESGR